MSSNESIAPHIQRYTGFENQADIEQLLNGFASQQIAVHGIRKEASIDRVAETGVEPNCPDVYPTGSFWTSGNRVFFSGDPEDPMSTFDTSFFHYAHAKSRQSDKITMAAALTTREAIQSAMSDWNDRQFDSGYFALHKTMPPDKLHLVVVQNERLDGTEIPRINTILIQHRMLSALVNVAVHGIELGARTYDRDTN